jgi:pimeloyl-ACP methyl ester carboxylesterase
MRSSSAILALLLIAGCADNPPPANPSFPVSFSDAWRVHKELAAARRPLARPLVIVGGYWDFFNINAGFARNVLREVIDDDRMVIVNVNTGHSVQDLRRALIETVDREFPSVDPAFTTEIDVVGQSLGGLIARYAAAPSDDPAQPRRLKVARLFTISSPHRGADFAAYGITDFQRDLAPGSAFLARVEQFDGSAAYELHPYVLLGDSFVGHRNAAPTGSTPYWLASQSIQAHPASQSDRRILADIALRLRGESPFSRLPAAAFPPGW